MRFILFIFLILLQSYVSAFGAESCAHFYSKTCRSVNLDKEASLKIIQDFARQKRREQLTNILKQNPEATRAGLKAAGIEEIFYSCKSATLSSEQCVSSFRDLMVDYSVLVQTAPSDLAEVDLFFKKYFPADKSVSVLDLSTALSHLNGLGFDTSLERPKRPKVEEYSFLEKNEIFNDAKNSLLAVINRLSIGKKSKERLATIVRSTALADNNCKTALNDIMASRAEYSPLDNKIHLCGKFASRELSVGALFAILSHEMAHSIDPCALGFSKTERNRDFLFAMKAQPFLGKKLSETVYDFRKLDDWYPIGNVAKCLRTENSIRARPDIKYQNLRNLEEENETLVKAKHKKRSNNSWASICGIQLGFESSKDRISESIADWLASETLVEKKKSDTSFDIRSAITDFTKTLCNPIADKTIVDDRFGSQHGGHSLNPRRLSHIFLANPVLKSQIGCEAKDVTYCDGSNSDYVSPNFAEDVWPKDHLLGSFDEILYRNESSQTKQPGSAR